MTPTLPSADELEVVALLKERDGQTFDGEAHLSSAEAAAITAQIERLTRERDEALAEIERMTPKFVAYDYLEAPSKAEAAEAEVKRLRDALTSAGQQAENAAWNIGKPGHKFTPADIQQGFFNIMEFCRSALSGGTSNG
jgi:hypothetical protein